MIDPKAIIEITEGLSKEAFERDLSERQEEKKEEYEKINSKQYIDEETKKIRTRSETIGHILKFLRKEQKLTQKTVADNIGIAQQTYAGYESGKHEPSIEIAIRLSEFYGLSLDYITGRFVGTYEESSRFDEEDYYLNLILRYSLSYYARAEQTNKEQIELIKKTMKQ